MKKMSKSPARGKSQSRSHSGRTLLAGKPLFLPTKGVPVVMQSLTSEQITAIPKNVFSVKVLGQEKTVERNDAIKMACSYPSDRKVGIVVSGGSAIRGLTEDVLKERVNSERPIKPIDLEPPAPMKRDNRPDSGICRGVFGGIIGAVVGTCIFPANVVAGIKGVAATGVIGGGDGEDGDEERYVVAVEHIKKALSILSDLRDKRRKKRANRDKDNPPTPDRGIFSPVIDENLLSDCVLKVKNQFFGNNDTFTRDYNTYKVMDFCFLVFLVLARMGIITNKLRKPYCEFLQEKVFMDKIPNVRSFNNCANLPEHKKLETLLPNLKFGFLTKTPPDVSENKLYYVCHEIGWAFHETDYFKKLRTQKNCLAHFTL